jgi:hypothetical protein
MANYNVSYGRYKYYLPQRIGPGALSNDQVKMCKICSQNGYHNEPIVFRKHNCKWIPLNYYDGQKHEHHYQIT